MSYKELRAIADDDSIAEKMPEEEYELLSVQLWRKFSLENGITEQRASFAPLSAKRERAWWQLGRRVTS